MGILRDYNANGVPVGNRIKFDSNDRPLVIKDVPLEADSKIPQYTSDASRKLTDLERISKLMIKPEGLKFLGNNAMLDQLNFQPNPNKTAAGKVIERVGSGLLNTAKLLGSTLAQVPVSGTGIHFVQSFEGIKGTYLERKGVIKQGDVPPHVQVKPGNKPLFIGKDKRQKITGTVNIAPDKIKERTDDGNFLIGPAGEQYSTGPDPDDSFVSSPNVRGPYPFNSKQKFIKDSSESTLIDRSLSPAASSSISVRLNMGDPGAIGDSVDTEVRKDKLNLLGPITTTDDSVPLDGTKEGRDIIKFRIEVITPGDSNTEPKTEHLYFRAYLDSFSDGYGAKWSSFNYLGRAEEFHTYGGFNRSINVGFKIAAQSRDEMKPLYQKLNTLIGSTAPTYDNNIMRGTLAKLTVGDYIYRLPGFIEKVDVQWGQDYPWEIAMRSPEGDDIDTAMQELPMILDVSLSFKPIHNFVPTADSIVGGEQFKTTLTANKYITHGKVDKNKFIKQINK